MKDWLSASRTQINNYAEIQDFILKCVYNEKKESRSNYIREKHWNKMKKKNTSWLNPDRDSLLQHIKRANYQSFIFNQYYNQSPPPSPFGNGWERDTSGNTVPVMFLQESVPYNIQELRLNSQAIITADNNSDDEETIYCDEDNSSSSEEDEID